MELGVSHEQSLSSLTPVVDNTFDKYNKNLVPIRSLSDHDSTKKLLRIRIPLSHALSFLDLSLYSALQ